MLWQCNQIRHKQGYTAPRKPKDFALLCPSSQLASSRHSHLMKGKEFKPSDSHWKTQLILFYLQHTPWHKWSSSWHLCCFQIQARLPQEECNSFWPQPQRSCTSSLKRRPRHKHLHCHYWSGNFIVSKSSLTLQSRATVSMVSSVRIPVFLNWHDLSVPHSDAPESNLLLDLTFFMLPL